MIACLDQLGWGRIAGDQCGWIRAGRGSRNVNTWEFALDPRADGEPSEGSEQGRGMVRRGYPAISLAARSRWISSVLLKPESQHRARCQSAVGAPAFVEGKHELEGRGCSDRWGVK